jgi:mRNA interferase RelE/StbE
MAWKIEFQRPAERELEKLNGETIRRILGFLHNRIANSENPRSIGEALRGSELGNFWKYRVGDYRLIADIDDEAVRILIVRIGNRRDIYRR